MKYRQQLKAAVIFTSWFLTVVAAWALHNQGHTVIGMFMMFTAGFTAGWWQRNEDNK